MTKDAVKYLDNRIREDYEWILKYDKANLDKNHLSYSQQIQYLYARSYFKDIPVDIHLIKKHLIIIKDNLKNTAWKIADTCKE
jgi:hypothetical protein